MASLAVILLVASALGAGTMGGFFYAFSGLVMPALARRPAVEGAETMRIVNVVVLNPLFFAIFFGTAATGLAAATLAFASLPGMAGLFAAAGATLYLAGSIGVTVARNVPLNQALEASPEGPAREALWNRYLDEWTRWNHVRAVACCASSVAFTAALIP